MTADMFPIDPKADGQDTLPVIDFHSHILPGMDDGSKSVAMSLDMLARCRQQGIDLLLATPHFYGFREHVQAFLTRRERAWEQLAAAKGHEGPAILLGAEVTLYSGLTALEGLDRLCLANTRTLLLEMPFAAWGGLELDAVSTLSLDRGYRVVLAHFERFLPLQKDTGVLHSLLELPVELQINAGRLTGSFGERRRALAFFRSGRARLLGSDCHNLDSRPPNLGPARAYLRKKLGPQPLREIDSCGLRLLGLYQSDDGD